MVFAITIGKDIPFDPAYTFDCGQAFRWRNVEGQGKSWLGIVSGNVLKVDRGSIQVVGVERKSNGKKELAEDEIRNYLSLEHDLDQILSSFPKDDYLVSAIGEFRGLRILQQDPWECLVSFLCSINCNIPSIKLKIENLCRHFGNRIDSNELDAEYYSFPEPSQIAAAGKKELMECKLGFRWKYVRHVAIEVSSGRLDLQKISMQTYEQARRGLISENSNNTFGVGPKVADCVLLFSLGKLEAFPLDVWMIRCIKANYANLLSDSLMMIKADQLTRAKYERWSDKIREHFGNKAGYAQQYLYMKSRSESGIGKRKQPVDSFNVQSGFERK